MLQYEFMRRALFAGLLLSLIIPTIGVVMVNRKTAMVGDALSHTALAGVALGLILGVNPVAGAMVVCIFAAFAIEGIRKRFPGYGDMATAIIMSTGLGMAAILSDFAPGGNAFESYLFGSISSVTPQDLVQVTLAFIAVMTMAIVCYGGLLNLSVDPLLARLSGVRTTFINGLFTLLSAITIAMASKIVGALMVASLIVLPVATALMAGRSYRQTFLLALGLGAVYMLGGITLSYEYGLKPGGAMVMLAITGMLLTSLTTRLQRKNRKIPEVFLHGAAEAEEEV
ncbi:Zinc ABC transporter, inner membrane permease protein ZnuB [Clostridiaceae bacterium JG1575]|nr:Zinc ABC transporter, inner membrane permease protein ZnuB [Clostridiaceae bacterium JG1575]